MCGLIWLPEAEDEPPAREALQVVGGVVASVIGLRANATAMPVPSSIARCARPPSSERQERVVAGLGRPHPVVAGLLDPADVGRRAGGIAADLAVDLHFGDASASISEVLRTSK